MPSPFDVATKSHALWYLRVDFRTYFARGITPNRYCIYIVTPERKRSCLRVESIFTVLPTGSDA